MAKRQLICFLFLWILVLWKSGYVEAELRTIDFDHLPNGTPIEHGTPITDAYAEWGVTLNCYGTYPDYYPNYNAYAYNDTRAHSPNNVMGGRIIGENDHWLNFSLCYGSAEFEDPVDMFRVYGAGDSFELAYYNQDGVKRGLGDSVVGHIFSSGDSFLEISAESGYLISGDVIKRVEFGSITGDHDTYFDDLTFNAPGPAITVSDSMDPYDDLQVPFGNVTEGSFSEATVTIANDGDDSLIIGAVGTLEAPFNIETDNCSGKILGQGQSCALTVRFTPTTTGTFNDSFDIPSNDPDEDSVTISVSGTGTATVPTPPEVMEVNPHDNAGIGDDDMRVPHNTSFGVLIVDSDGIDITDTDSIRFTIDDGVNLDEIDLDDTRDIWVRVTKLDPDESETAVTQLWAVYHRAEHDARGNSYFYDNQINITVDARDNTGLPMVQQSHAFKIETETEHDDAEVNSPDTVPVAGDDPALDHPDYIDAVGIEVTSGDLEGAKIVYDNSEPVQPTLGPTDELPLFDEADVDGVGVSMNLQPPTVFTTPVKIFIPLPSGTDATRVSIYLYNGTDWVEAYDAEGLLSGGRGCIVPKSRVNNDPGAGQPNVSIQMYHFTGVQVGISTSTSSAPSGGGGGGSGGGCFIATAGYGSPVEKHVTTLKNFRDTYILPYALGRILVRTYYKYSPSLAHFIAKHDSLRAMVRIGLLPLVAVTYSTIHFGPVITFTMLVSLVVLPIFLVSFYRRKAQSHKADR